MLYTHSSTVDLCVLHSSSTGMVYATHIWNREKQCTLRGQIYSHNFPCSPEGTNYENKFPPWPMQEV